MVLVAVRRRGRVVDSAATGLRGLAAIVDPADPSEQEEPRASVLGLDGAELGRFADHDGLGTAAMMPMMTSALIVVGADFLGDFAVATHEKLSRHCVNDAFSLANAEGWRRERKIFCFFREKRRQFHRWILFAKLKNASRFRSKACTKKPVAIFNAETCKWVRSLATSRVASNCYSRLNGGFFVFRFELASEIAKSFS